MSLVFLDSFDGYSTNEVPLRWNQSNGATIIAGGRNGKGCNVPSGGGPVKVVPYNNAWVVGFAFKNNSARLDAGAIYTAYTPRAQNICQIFVETDGSISLYTQASNLPFANTSANNFYLYTNTWYYIEIMWMITPTFDINGNPAVLLNVQGLRVNKQTVLTGSTLVTWNYTTNSLTAQPKINQHSWSFNSGNPGGCTIDDLYIFNQDAGTPNSTFAGDIKILVIKPIQDLATPFLTHGGSGSSFSCINETPADYDASYLYDNTNQDFDNFNWQQLPAFYGSVICVQYSIFARKDDEGSRAFVHTMGSGPGQVSSAHYIGDSYLYYMWELDTGPGGAPWTVALFNATSFGFQVFTIPIPS